MPVVTLPDGSQRRFDKPVTVDEVAGDIGAGLRKAALAGRVNGKLVDTSFLISNDVELAIVTDKDPDGIEVIRHSTAHLLAQAVKQLFPDAQVTIGPVIQDGFYYDFSYKRPFTTEDLAAIEAKMTELAKADQKVSRRVLTRDEAVRFFKHQGEIYKAEIIASIPDKDEISLYGQGDWVDLCRGPHVPSTGKLKAFKLTKVAGAYWRGDSRNEMLQRIYGTAWADKKQLDEYLRHLETFGENMFLTKTPDERTYCIKPMNCPGHVQIFKHGLRSYRELPVRFCEFGKVHRYEPSGALHGLMRVRAFTQDDAHVFITQEQITDEAAAITRLILDIYRDFGFDDLRIKFADRPPKRVGSDEIWDTAEKALVAATKAAGIEYTLNPGEGAFYGPKLEFVLRDAIGRDWQCGTLQVDLNMPGRLGAYFIDEHSAKATPVMLHRAIFGSLERFFAILLEHHSGRLPAWLSPTQAVIMTITDRQDDYVRRVTESLKNQGFRVSFDLRNEKVGFKIREHTLQRVPYLLVAGDKEVAANLLSVRTRSGKDLGTMSPETFAERLRIELNSRGRQTLEG
jgi:threonyl-tRNA synthetase